jgi:hypothetical protein
VQEAARAAAREEEREGAEAAKGRGGGASVGGVKRKRAIFFSDSDFVSLVLLKTRSQGSVNHAHIQKKKKKTHLLSKLCLSHRIFSPAREERKEERRERRAVLSALASFPSLLFRARMYGTEDQVSGWSGTR